MGSTTLWKSDHPHLTAVYDSAVLSVDLTARVF